MLKQCDSCCLTLILIYDNNNDDDEFFLQNTYFSFYLSTTHLKRNMNKEIVFILFIHLIHFSFDDATILCCAAVLNLFHHHTSCLLEVGNLCLHIHEFECVFFAFSSSKTAQTLSEKYFTHVFVLFMHAAAAAAAEDVVMRYK